MMALFFAAMAWPLVGLLGGAVVTGLVSLYITAALLLLPIWAVGRLIHMVFGLRDKEPKQTGMGRAQPNPGLAGMEDTAEPSANETGQAEDLGALGAKLVQAIREAGQKGHPPATGSNP
jgi:hypothetical protein